MKQYNKMVVGTMLAVMALVFFGGCAPPPPPVEVQETIFYPAAPNPPRLQFLTQITELDPNPEKSTSGFADFVVGATVEKGEEIRAPYGVAARDGKVYVCDISIANIYIIDRANNKYTRMGKSGVFKKPVNITIAPDGTKYVCDTGLGKVVVFDAQDRFVRYLSDPSRGRPMDIALCKGELIVADIAKNEVEAWAMDGKFLRKIAAFGKGVDQVRMPTNVEVGPKGRIFVSETLNGVIKKFNNKGQYLGDVGAQGDRAGFFARPKGLAIAPDGVLYVADSQWEKIQVFGPEGRLLMAFGGARPGPSGMGMPAGIAIDLTGVPAFEKYIDKDFQAEYLLFVANQYGPNKIGVYAFGKSKTATYKSIKRTTATTPGKPKATTKPVGLPGGADK